MNTRLAFNIPSELFSKTNGFKLFFENRLDLCLFLMELRSYREKVNNINT